MSSVVPYGPFEIEIVPEAIHQLSRPVDAILCPDDPSLSHSHGDARSLSRKAGREVQQWLRDLPDVRFRLGHVDVSPGGNCGAEFLVHAVVLDDRQRAMDDHWSNSVRAVVCSAIREGWKTLAIPVTAAASGDDAMKSFGQLLTVLEDVGWDQASGSGLPLVIVAARNEELSDRLDTLVAHGLVDQRSRITELAGRAGLGELLDEALASPGDIGGWARFFSQIMAEAGAGDSSDRCTEPPPLASLGLGDADAEKVMRGAKRCSSIEAGAGGDARLVRREILEACEPLLVHLAERSRVETPQETAPLAAGHVLYDVLNRVRQTEAGREALASRNRNLDEPLESIDLLIETVCFKMEPSKLSELGRDLLLLVLRELRVDTRQLAREKIPVLAQLVVDGLPQPPKLSFLISLNTLRRQVEEVTASKETATERRSALVDVVGDLEIYLREVYLPFVLPRQEPSVARLAQSDLRTRAKPNFGDLLKAWQRTKNGPKYDTGTRLANPRNKLVHDKNNEVVPELCSALGMAITELMSDPDNPCAMVVRSVEVDRWGRRTVRLEDADQNQHVIWHRDLDPSPGDVWLVLVQQGRREHVDPYVMPKTW